MADDDPQDSRDQLLVMLDPEWQPVDDGDVPPDESVLGGWRVDADGAMHRFEPNPGYRPMSSESPTDPADAALRLVVQGDADGERLLAVLDDVLFAIAVNDNGSAVIVPSPDNVPSVLVATAPRRRIGVDVPGWLENMTLRELAQVLPGNGVDVLLNPGAPYSMRLLTAAIKEFVGRAEKV